MNKIEEHRNKLENYIEKWEKIEDVKPENEPEFLEPFKYLLKNVDLSEYGMMEFDGDNDYFGKQVTILFEPHRYGTYTKLKFEIAYNDNKCSIYSGYNNGYWVPEYAVLEGDDYKEIKELLFNQILKCVGLDGYYKRNEK